MTPDERRVFVVGRFPPPFDGQTIATNRIAELLEHRFTVQRINTSAPDAGHVAPDVTFRPERFRHYVGAVPALERQLRPHPLAPVLWASVSPALLGHWRDMLTVYPVLGSRRPIVAVVHRGNFDKVFKASRTKLSARMLVNRVAGFAFLTDNLAAACAPWIPEEKRLVVPNTIQSEVMCSESELRAKRHDRLSRQSLRLLYLSNMIREKGYLQVLHAVRLLRDRGVAVEATFVGGWVSDQDREDFQRYVSEHDLVSIVKHEGAVRDRHRIKELHLMADVFLLPTSYPTEAQPIAIMEAMNAGTPLIVSPQGGIPEMARDGREAIFVSASDASAVADAVLALQAPHDWLAMSEAVRARFDAEFSSEVVRQRWESIIDSVAA